MKAFYSSIYLLYDDDKVKKESMYTFIFWIMYIIYDLFYNNPFQLQLLHKLEQKIVWFINQKKNILNLSLYSAWTSFPLFADT